MTVYSIENCNILISGAGIAGLALAYWLNRYGFKPSVVEKAPALWEDGHAIEIRSVAQEVAARMEILAELRRAHTNIQDIAFVNHANKPLACFAPDMMGNDIGFIRGDLIRILYAVTKGKTEYIWGDSIASLVQKDDGVDVTFEHGQSQTYDLVVGADGVRSNVRALTFGDESQFIRYLGYYAALFSTANHLNLDYQERIYRMPGKIAGMYSVRQNTEARAKFYFASPRLHSDHLLTSEQQQRVLKDTFAGEGWEIPRLLASMGNARDIYFDAIDMICMDIWSKGRIVLVGDAGYCVSQIAGQGASLALVGAYVLAGELKVAAGDYRSAFANYEKEMQEYVKLNQKLAANSGKHFAPPTRSQIWFDNQMLRMLPYMPCKNAILKELRQPYNAITLKKYG